LGEKRRAPFVGKRTNQYPDKGGVPTGGLLVVGNLNLSTVV